MSNDRNINGNTRNTGNTGKNRGGNSGGKNIQQERRSGVPNKYQNNGDLTYDTRPGFGKR